MKSLNDNVNKYKDAKAFLIARVSDSSQRKALPAQKLRLDEYAERLELNSEYHEFDETAFKADREQFITIINNAMQYKGFYILVFDKIDRLTRDVSSEIVRKLKEMAYSGACEIHFPSDGLVLHKNSPAHDKTRFDMGMVFGGYYSMAISDNVKRKIQQKLHEGEYPGKACIGYINTRYTVEGKEFKTIVPDPARKQYIIKAFKLRLAGNSFRTIAKTLKEDGLVSNTKKLGPVGQSQIETMLKNPFYYGVMRYDGNTYSHKYEPIITKELFDLVQKVNDERNTDDHSKTNTKQTYTFSGILKCATCGCSISSYMKKGHVYMRCTKSKAGVSCDQPHVSEAELIPQVTKLLEDLRISEELANKVITYISEQRDNSVKYYQDAIKQTRVKYNQLEGRIETLYSDRLDGRITVDEYDKYVTQAKSDMEKLDTKLVELTNNDTSFVVTAEHLLKLAYSAKDIFESSQSGQRNKILRALLANLKLNEKRLQLHLLKPFSVLVHTLETQSWLRQLGSNQRPIG